MPDLWGYGDGSVLVGHPRGGGHAGAGGAGSTSRGNVACPRLVAVGRDTPLPRIVPSAGMGGADLPLHGGAALRHPCPSCGRVTSNPGRCPGCTEAADGGFYKTAAWQRLRSAHLARQPMCVRCGARGVDVDHVIPRERGGRDVDANLETLCKACHASKTRHDQPRDPRYVHGVMHRRPTVGMGGGTDNPGDGPAKEPRGQPDAMLEPRLPRKRPLVRRRRVFGSMRMAR